MKSKLPNDIAIEVRKLIQKGELKTKAICDKYKKYDLKPHDIYNIKHGKYYKHLDYLIVDNKTDVKNLNNRAVEKDTGVEVTKESPVLNKPIPEKLLNENGIQIKERP